MDTHILCIETSGPQCTVAISKNGICTSEIKSDGQWKHSQYLTTYIKEALSNSQLEIHDIKAVAISGGPGSYTGLRVGAATAKGICYAKDIPLISLDTLKIIAYPELEKLNKDYSLIISTIDARRDEIYYNIYDNELQSNTDVSSYIVTPDSFSDRTDNGIIICGDGSQKIKDITEGRLSDHSIIVNSLPEAKNMTLLAYESFKASKHEDIAYYNPFYMKPPNITTRKKPLF